MAINFALSNMFLLMEKKKGGGVFDNVYTLCPLIMTYSNVIYANG